MLSFAGCGEKEKAETAVSKMLDAFKAQKYDEAQKHINGGYINNAHLTTSFHYLTLIL